MVTNMGKVKAADPTRYASVTVPSVADVMPQTPKFKDEEVVSGASSVGASILVAFGLAAVAMREQW